MFQSFISVILRTKKLLHVTYFWKMASKRDSSSISHNAVLFKSGSWALMLNFHICGFVVYSTIGYQYN